jgi:hypothetical protein
MSRLLLAVLVALAVGATVAAARPKDPRTLALRAADFPAGAKVSRIDDVAGPGGKVYGASFNFTVRGREEEVTDEVWFVPSNAKSPTPGLVAGPQATYRSEVGQVSGFAGEQALHLPRYGAEQTATWADYHNSDGAERARAALVVREGSFIWTLTIESCGTLAPFGCFFGPTPPRITHGQAVAELRRYAAKQKERIDNA